MMQMGVDVNLNITRYFIIVHKFSEKPSQVITAEGSLFFYFVFFYFYSVFPRFGLPLVIHDEDS